VTFSVVVLDDNPFVRESIIKTIDWSALGCEVVGEAADGMEGKEIVLAKKPNIVITDICMPSIDGLKLTEIIKPVLPHTKIIAITGYQDFEYAKRAVKLGMFDFVLKPIKNEELQGVVKSAVKELIHELNERSEHEIILEKNSRLEKRLLDSLPALREKKVLDIINGNIEFDGDINDTLEKLGIRSQKHVLIILRSRFNAGFDFKRYYIETTKFFNGYKARMNIEVIYFDIDGDVAFLVLFNKLSSANESLNKVKILCGELEKKIQNEGSVRQYLIAASPLYSNLSGLHEAYKDIREAMRINFFKSDCRIIYPDSLRMPNNLHKYSILNDLEEFYKVLESSDETMISQLELLMDKISVYSNWNIFVAKGLLVEICITAARYLYRHSLSENELAKSINEILLEVDSLQDMEQSTRYVKEYICTINSILRNKNKQYSQIISSVIGFINTNYMEDISLESVAEKFMINPSYLSRTLKKETGRNFTDMVSSARIKAAKKLLKVPGNRVNEIAEQVGYKDYAYFYQVFKRLECITPTEYKNSSKKI
jgi:two-component system, response regulator YesN